jgi:hypothetical protein
MFQGVRVIEINQICLHTTKNVLYLTAVRTKSSNQFCVLCSVLFITMWQRRKYQKRHTHVKGG